ncbi:hypothetical protein HALLA_04135 (plasmid) [Halostagnicola larsenii XH-48]|uniref:Uncharacterized protein n=1 Tax=Halostagnicola larsenii XH-48 TaxID=797299 RepID=W0JSL3_9EURY|nr:hypothetical protein [Halostagnicola larsenii]AHG01594.1 hypothetical protein HALLA_04135 [Halostagnicola larsenii XH-48]
MRNRSIGSVPNLDEYLETNLSILGITSFLETVLSRRRDLLSGSCNHY